MVHVLPLVLPFLSTPSARRATLFFTGHDIILWNFYPRPPRGGRPNSVLVSKVNILFLSTPSARRATVSYSSSYFRLIISIHALREEGDPSNLIPQILQVHFYPRPPRGGRQRPDAAEDRGCHFYPRPPRGGRRRRPHRQEMAGRFLSTPSARRATDPWYPFTSKDRFLSTPSARRATPKRDILFLLPKYFYPRPPRGGRQQRRTDGHRLRDHFYPRPPRGGRLGHGLAFAVGNQFLSTPSARRATNLLPGQKIAFAFLSTPSARRATSLVPLY